MRPSPLMVGLSFLAVLGIGGGIMLNSEQQRRPMSQAAMTEELSQHLLTLSGQRLKAVECAQLDQGLVIPGSRCFLSVATPEDLFPAVKKAIDPLGTTPGWTNDYSVWGAFYAARDEPRRTFGVTITPLEGNRDFEANPLVKGYRSLVDVVVNSTLKGE